MIRQIAAPKATVDALDVGPLTNLFGPDSLTAEQARELQGTVMVTFPDNEIPDVRLYDDPAVRAYVREAHASVPHLMYFLSPEPMAGTLEAFVTSQMTPDEYALTSGQAPQRLPDHVYEALMRHLVVVAAYATHVGDDWRAIVTALLEVLPEASRRSSLELLEDAFNE